MSLGIWLIGKMVLYLGSDSYRDWQIRRMGLIEAQTRCSATTLAVISKTTILTDKIINDDWLFKTNSKEQIRLWVSNLKYAYFWRRPSFRDDSDYITLTLDFYDFNDLVDILGKLGIELKKIDEDFPLLVINKPYTWNEFEKFKNPIFLNTNSRHKNLLKTFQLVFG